MSCGVHKTNIVKKFIAVKHSSTIEGNKYERINSYWT